MIFAIAIPQLFGLGKFRGHNDDVDERRQDVGCWLVQLYQLSGNRCVCVRRGTIQGCGLEFGCLFFSNLLLFSLLFVSTPCQPIFSLPILPTTIQPHTRPPHLDIPWKRRTRGHKALVACFGISLIIIISGTAQLPRSYTAEGSQLGTVRVPVKPRGRRVLNTELNTFSVAVVVWGS